MNEEIHGGIIRVSMDAAREMFGDVISINSTDIQGVLRDKGVFAEVRTRLLLPESYIVHNIFFQWILRTWSIVVEGPDLPLAVEGLELPQVTPVYRRNEDGSTSLVRIDI